MTRVVALLPEHQIKRLDQIIRGSRLPTSRTEIVRDILERVLFDEALLNEFTGRSPRVPAMAAAV